MIPQLNTRDKEKIITCIIKALAERAGRIKEFETKTEGDHVVPVLNLNITIFSNGDYLADTAGMANEMLTRAILQEVILDSREEEKQRNAQQAFSKILGAIEFKQSGQKLN